jgi:hypothetical protein
MPQEPPSRTITAHVSPTTNALSHTLHPHWRDPRFETRIGPESTKNRPFCDIAVEYEIGKPCFYIAVPGQSAHGGLIFSVSSALHRLRLLHDQPCRRIM